MVEKINVEKTTLKGKRWLWLIWGMCILLAFVRGRVAGIVGSDFIDEFMQALGGGTTLYLFPFLLLLIPTKLFKFFKYNSVPHLLILAILCLLLGLMTIAGSLYNLKNNRAVSSYENEEKASTRQSQASNGYTFGGDEYTVTFPVEPEIKEMMVSFGNLSYKGKHAELKLSGEALVRAEHFNLPSADAMSIDREYAYEAMRKYAEYNGMEKIEITFNQNEMDKICYLRGYKTFTSSGGTKRHAIYEVKSYVGNDSMLLVYAGGASEGYPQSGIVKFFKSVVRK